MCKVHRIIIIRITLNVEIRRLPPADINTIVQFNFCILIAHRDKVKERTSFRSILFCPLGFRVRCRFLSAHIGRYPARVTSALCHIFYLQSSKLIQDRRIISLTIGGRDNRIVQRDTLEQQLFQSISAHSICPLHGEPGSQTLQQQTGIIAPLRTLNHILTIYLRHIHMLQIEYIRHLLHIFTIRRINRIDHRRIYLHRLHIR